MKGLASAHTDTRARVGAHATRNNVTPAPRKRSMRARDPRKTSGKEGFVFFLIPFSVSEGLALCRRDSERGLGGWGGAVT